MSPLTRLRAMAGVAVAMLGHERLRTALAIAGVAMAVLAAILLVSMGLGVVETGQEKFDSSGRDLWVTGGPVEFQPGTVGGFENTLVDAHEVAGAIDRREDVTTAVPMAFQTVYASPGASSFQTVVAAGAPARGPSVSITAGQPFANRDIHYANGSYTGPVTGEAVLDERAATLLGVSVNDTIHVGGTIATAREQEFRVVGISPTYSRFVGAPTVTLHLSELQEVVGTTASDRATFVSVSLTDGADVAAVEADLQERYPDYTVRTNREQLQATLQEQAVVVASGVSLVVLAVVAGVLLVVNLQLSFVARHRDSLAALQAIGTSTASLLTLLGVHTLTVGLLGGVLGVLLAIPATSIINVVVAAVTGFEGVMALSVPVLVGGFGVAVVVSTIGALAAGVYLTRVRLEVR